MDIVERMRGFEADHEPDGWPAIQMKQVRALCDEVDALRAELQQLREQDNKDRDMLITLMSAFDTEHSICGQCGHQEETMYMDSANMLRNYLADNSIEFRAASPRITEQGAREIAIAAVKLLTNNADKMIDIWLNGDGRALLNKLKAKGAEKHNK